MGPTLYAMPDPAGYASGDTIPTTGFKTLMDSAPTGNRGTRLSLPENYFDGGYPSVPQPTGPDTRPTFSPLSSGQWLSPAPDGTGWWVWGDHYEGAMFIDGPSKQGIVMLASVGTGKCWYANSTLNYDGRAAELHVYDPAHVGAVAQGTRNPDSVRPVSMAMLPNVAASWWTNSTGNGPCFVPSYDPIGKKLYVLCFGAGIDAYHNRLYVYNCNV